MAERALRDAGCLEGSPGAAPVRIWSPVERAVFYRPRVIDGLPATNRVVAYLDLAISGVDRYLRAAEAVWDQAR